MKRWRPWLSRAFRALVASAAIGFAYLTYVWITLPDVRPLATTRPEITAFMRMRAAEARAAGRPVRQSHRYVPYRQISPQLTRAVLVTEDAGFWGHQGIDFGELRAAIDAAWPDITALRGASTLTQQLAKNLYLSEARTPTRKLVELLIARRLEADLSKTRIFELYLNYIEWGDGIWGADAAARFYFGRPASDLSAAQAALLAGAIINPRIYSPAHPNGRLLRRQQIVLRRMGAGAVPTTTDDDLRTDPEPAIEE